MKHRAIPLRRLIVEQPDPDDEFEFEPAAALLPQDADQYQLDAISENVGPFIPEDYL